MASALRVHPVDDVRQLAGIRSLQTANLRRTVGEAEAAREGFVTAEYSLEFLGSMHEVAPSIVATDGEAVVGYALVSERSVGMGHPLLRALFEATDLATLRGTPLNALNYVVCGQLCVAKSHRGRGLVERMYGAFRDEYCARWECVVTDVVTDNPRSLRAHARAGFEVVATIPYDGAEWWIVAWDWRGTCP